MVTHSPRSHLSDVSPNLLYLRPKLSPTNLAHSNRSVLVIIQRARFRNYAKRERLFGLPTTIACSARGNVSPMRMWWTSYACISRLKRVKGTTLGLTLVHAVLFRGQKLVSRTFHTSSSSGRQDSSKDEKTLKTHCMHRELVSFVSKALACKKSAINESWCSFIPLQSTVLNTKVRRCCVWFCSFSDTYWNSQCSEC